MVFVLTSTVTGVLVWYSRAWEPLVYHIRYVEREEAIVPGHDIRFRCLSPRYPFSMWLAASEEGYYRNGFMYCDNGDPGTFWDEQGRVRMQLEDSEVIDSPPWRWGAKDQLEPNPPPWLHDDALFH